MSKRKTKPKEHKMTRSCPICKENNIIVFLLASEYCWYHGVKLPFARSLTCIHSTRKENENVADCVSNAFGKNTFYMTLGEVHERALIYPRICQTFLGAKTQSIDIEMEALKS